MTYKFKNVYLEDSFTISGMYEKNGDIGNYFDKVYDKDLYFGMKTWEKAEIKLLREAIDRLLDRNKLKYKDIDLIISGDLQNQIAASSYAVNGTNIAFLGIYSACSTIGEGIILASTFIDSKRVNNAIVATSSHNMVSEKQFRNPTEYGTIKPKSATFTATGGVSVLLSNKRSDIRVESCTISRVYDMQQYDVNHMGAVMAPAAAESIYEHLTSLNREVGYYDLIVTGDLGIYGKKILIDYLKEKYDIDISCNYNDCGVMLYDTKRQPVYAGASGPVTSALVTFGYLVKKMKEKKLKKILVVPTGALFSPNMVFQKSSIPSIAHSFSLEVVE